MTFRVGQKVVCVDGSMWESWSTIKQGHVYTVSSVVVHPDGKPGIHLDEVLSVANMPYYAYRFRPIVERKTDISIFTAMLKPQTTERRLDAVLHDHGFDPPQ